MTEASFKDLDVLKAITGLCDKNLAPPSVREIQIAMGYKSPNSITRHLTNLVSAGLIERLPGYRCYMPVAWKQRMRDALDAAAHHLDRAERIERVAAQAIDQVNQDKD